MKAKMDFPRLKWIILYFICSFMLQVSHAQPVPIPVGRVIWIKGTLKALMPNKEERILQRKSILYLHDTLITDPTSQAQIGFTDQTLMTIRGNSRFYIDQYQYKTKSNSGQLVMNLVKGGFRTITGTIAKNNPDNYTVNTPVATIGVRGTDYQVYYENEKLYLGYYAGNPCVMGKKNCSASRSIDSPSSFAAKKPNKQNLCLSKNSPYARVNGPCAIPEPLSTKPSVFDKDLSIVKEKIDPFEFPKGSGTSDGVVNSFCIR